VSTGGARKRSQSGYRRGENAARESGGSCASACARYIERIMFIKMKRNSRSKPAENQLSNFRIDQASLSISPV
jgi:hypothetical protein